MTVGCEQLQECQNREETAHSVELEFDHVGTIRSLLAEVSA